MLVRVGLRTRQHGKTGGEEEERRRRRLVAATALREAPGEAGERTG